MRTKTLGASLLIVGTCIGAAMLTLPISTASSGFARSLFLLAGTWLLMLYTGLLVMEVNFQLPEGSNFFTMAKEMLGKWGKYIVLVVYILLLYSLMSAYETGGGELTSGILQTLIHHPLPSWTGDIIIACIFGGIVYCGTGTADYVNRLLMIGLIITYVCLVVAIVPHINMQYLENGYNKYLLMASPFFFTAFGFHIVLPTIRCYLESNLKQMRTAIFFGATLCFIIYFFWELAIFGVIPHMGKDSLDAIMASGEPSTGLTQTLSDLLKSQWITEFSAFFTFFALGTSFVGVSLSLFDFLMDTLHFPKTSMGRLKAIAIAFIPPFIFALAYPRGFIIALGYAGAFVAILHGIVPAAMAWVGRKRGTAKEYVTPGGIAALVVVVLLSLVVIGVEVVS